MEESLLLLFLINKEIRESGAHEDLHTQFRFISYIFAMSEQATVTAEESKIGRKDFSNNRNKEF